MTDDARLRAVEMRVSVHEAECGLRQRQILESIQSLRDDGSRRDAKLSSIQKGVWSAAVTIAGMAGSVWLTGVTVLRHLVGG